MLKQRIATAIVLLIPSMAVLFFLSSAWVTAFFGVFIAVAAWEWAGLIGLRSRAVRVLYGVVVIGLSGAIILHGSAVVTAVLCGAVLFWTLALAELIRRPGVHEGWLHGTPARQIVGIAVLVPPLVAVYSLHASDGSRPFLLLCALALVWVADSAAYFAGHFFGRVKLAPQISPGKTLEGAIGGLVGVALLAWLVNACWWRYDSVALGTWLILTVVAAAYSVLGDLLESKFKRAAGVKDSGAIFPGHGGVLDRIDATTAALPVFALGWKLMAGAA
jgi:phosphatidate cytidylyltransferase